MLEQEYKALFREIEPGGAVRERAFSRMLEEAERQTGHGGRKVRRALVTAAVCLLLAVLSVTVAAAAFPSFRAWLFGPGSGFAESMEPLDIACEEQGIRMEVIGAAASGDTAVAYFTLRDISGENRLDETTHVGVSSRRAANYRLEAKKTDETDQTGYNCALVDFDPESGTALMRLQVTAARDLSEMPLDFRVDLIVSRVGGGIYTVPLTEELLGDETLPIGGRAFYDFDNYVPGVGLGEPSGYTDLEEELQREDMSYIGHYRDKAGVPVVLKPREAPLALPGTDLVELSAVGYVNGVLRVQAYGTDELLSYTHPTLRAMLLPADCDLGRMARDSGYAREMEEEMPWLYENSVGAFAIPEDYGKPALGVHEFPYARYDEEAYAVPPEDLEQYQVGVRLYYEGVRLLGDWTAELGSLSKLENRLVTLTGLELPSGRVESLEISTLGLYVKSTVGVLKDVDTVKVYCGEQATEYERVTGSNSLFLYETRDVPGFPGTAKFAAKRPVDPARVTAVEIGGERIAVDTDSAGE